MSQSNGLNLWCIVLSTDAFRTAFIQHHVHDAGQVKDGLEHTLYAYLINRLAIDAKD